MKNCSPCHAAASFNVETQYATLRVDGQGFIASLTSRQDQNTREQLESLRVTSFVQPPASMYSGKVAAITAFIHPTQQPVLAAGDSGSDFPMLFHCVGARIWVEHHHTQPGLFEAAMKTYDQVHGAAHGWVRGSWDIK